MYRALYRKWRPLAFQDVVGQAPIVTALRNQITTQHVGHAYLFTGVRGTGKTTCAKIFAKAINCMNSDAGDPCGQCEACRGIENGSILDVVEMDAASNNGVDNIRDLRDETAYTPSACQYKVYIIDEVHMLSTAAFNALLKTLEEPPPHVVFILATTEIQKVPATILSRCQRYDFTRIQPSDLAARAQYVAQQEGLTLTDDAADLIARLADGAARDTLSILDTCAGVSSEIDAELVRRMTGVTDRSYLFAISHCILTGDSAGMLAEIASLRQKSVDLKRLTEELILHYRNLMLCALPNGVSLLSGVSPEEEAQYLSTCRDIPQVECVRAIQLLGTALEKMTRGGDARIELELALFSLHSPLPAAPVASVGVTSAPPATFARTPVAQPATFTRAPIAPAVEAPAPVPTAPPTATQQTAPAPPVVPTPPAAPPTPIAPSMPAMEAPVALADKPAPIAPPAPLEAKPPAMPEDDAPPPFDDNDAPPILSDSDGPLLPDDIDVPLPTYTDIDEVAFDDFDAEALTIDPSPEEETLIDSAKKRSKQRKIDANNPKTTAIGAQPSTDEIRRFVQLEALKETLLPLNKVLHKVFKEVSNAYVQGNILLIEVENPDIGSASSLCDSLNRIIDLRKENKETLDQAFKTVAGRTYNVRPYGVDSSATGAHMTSNLFSNLKAAGVEVSNKD